MSEDIAQLPSVSGTLSLNLQGNIIASSGELEGDTKTAEKIYYLMQDISSITRAAEKSDSLKRVSIAFGSYTYVATISNSTIYIVKKNNSS